MVRRIRIVLRALAATVAFALFVWYRAVLAVPAIKRRKTARRSARGAQLTARDRVPDRYRAES